MFYEINEDGYICEAGDTEPLGFSVDADPDNFRGDDGEINFDDLRDAENEGMEGLAKLISAEMRGTLAHFALEGQEDFRGVIFTHMKDTGVVYCRVGKEIPV